MECEEDQLDILPLVINAPRHVCDQFWEQMKGGNYNTPGSYIAHLLQQDRTNAIHRTREKLRISDATSETDHDYWHEKKTSTVTLMQEDCQGIHSPELEPKLTETRILCDISRIKHSGVVVLGVIKPNTIGLDGKADETPEVGAWEVVVDDEGNDCAFDNDDQEYQTSMDIMQVEIPCYEDCSDDNESQGTSEHSRIYEIDPQGHKFMSQLSDNTHVEIPIASQVLTPSSSEPHELKITSNELTRNPVVAKLKENVQSTSNNAEYTVLKFVSKNDRDDKMNYDQVPDLDSSSCPDWTVQSHATVFSKPTTLEKTRTNKEKTGSYESEIHLNDVVLSEESARTDDSNRVGKVEKRKMNQNESELQECKPVQEKIKKEPTSKKFANNKPSAEYHVENTAMHQYKQNDMQTTDETCRDKTNKNESNKKSPAYSLRMWTRKGTQLRTRKQLGSDDQEKGSIRCKQSETLSNKISLKLKNNKSKLGGEPKDASVLHCGRCDIHFKKLEKANCHKKLCPTIFPLINCENVADSTDASLCLTVSNEGMLNIEDMYKPNADSKQMTCVACNTVIPNSFQKQSEHLHKHQQKEYRCKECNLQSRHRYSILHHIADCHLGRKYVCSLCERRFITYTDAFDHVRKIHLGIGCIPCHHCEYLAFSGSQLENHRQEFHPETTPSHQYSCEICGKMYFNSDAFYAHVKRNHRDTGHECPYDGCSKVFLEKSGLNRHIDSFHEELRPHLCTVCGKQFSSKFVLKEHLSSVHDSARKFSCAYPGCLRSFKRKSHLTVHLRIHNDDKPLSCEQCDFRCRQRNSLNNHMKSHHSKDIN